MFGVESGHRETLLRTSKSLDYQEVFLAIREARLVGIETKTSFVIGFPWESKKDIIRTVRFARRIQADFAYFNVFKPLPGSPLFEEMSGRNEISEAPWSAYFTGDATSLFPTKTPTHTLKRIVRWAAFSFYFRPSYIMQSVLRLTTRPKRMIRVVISGLMVLARQIRYLRISVNFLAD